VRMRANVSAAGCAMLRMDLPAWIVWVGRFYYSVSLFFVLLVFDSLQPVSAAQAIDVWMPVMCSGEAAAVTVVAGFE
jgi:hypothetical protein